MKKILVCILIACQVQAQDLKSQFDRMIDSNFKSSEPGGVVIVSTKNKIIYERAFGMANLELNVPMNKVMVFNIASMTKQFTAIAILRLVEQNRLALSDTVGKFVHDLPDAIRGISIEQLLTHTGGVPNAKNINNLLIAGRGWLSCDQIMETFKNQPLDFKPGTAWAYSNSGYQVLGCVLEKITNKAYGDYMDDSLLAPLGMKHSRYGVDVLVTPNLASSYVYSRSGIRNAVNNNVQAAFAAGGLQSTAEDMVIWNRALLSFKLVGKETLGKAWTRSAKGDGTQTDYGYGWFVGELQGSRLVEHGGNMGGFMSHAVYLPDEDIYVAVLYNFRGKLPELLATEMAALAIGKPLNISPVKLPPELLQSYAGDYLNNTGVVYKIFYEDGKLFYQKTGGPKYNIIPYSKDKVYFDNTSTLGEIERDAKGKITRFAMQTRTGMSKYSIKRADY